MMNLLWKRYQQIEDLLGNLILLNLKLPTSSFRLPALFLILIASFNAIPSFQPSSIAASAQQAITPEQDDAEARARLAEAEALKAQNTDAGRKAALAKYQQAATLFHTAANYQQEAETIIKIGAAYSLMGEQQLALEAFNNALALTREKRLRQSEANTLIESGAIYKTLGEMDKAMESYNQALAIAKAEGLRTEEAYALNYLGSVFENLGDKEKALPNYQQALAIMREIGNRAGEGSILVNLGGYYQELGEKQHALEIHLQALPLISEGGNREVEAAALANLGSVYEDLGNIDKAMETYHRALLLAEQLGFRQMEAAVLTFLGRVSKDSGDRDKALEYLNQALKIEREIKYQFMESITLINVGNLYYSIGEKQRAIEYLNQALPITRTIRSLSAEASVLGNLGNIYGSLGEKERAIDFYNQVLRLSRQLKDKGSEANALNNIARFNSDLGNKQQALEYYQQALELNRASGLPLQRASLLASMGKVYADLKDHKKALEYYNQALPITREVKYPIGEAATLSNIGRSLSELGDKQQALEYFDKAIPMMKTLNYRVGEATSRYQRASTERDLKLYDKAIADIEEAIERIEFIRSNVGNQSLRASYFSTVRNYYDFYIDLLMQLHAQQPQQGFDVKAIQLSEKARARVLIEMLVESKIDLREGVDAKLVTRERELLEQVNQRATRLAQIPTDKIDARRTAERELAELENSYNEARTSIRQQNPKYEAIAQSQPLSLAEIQQQVLDSDTILLEYALGSERSYLWLVTKDSISSLTLPPTAEIENAVKSYRKSLLLLKAAIANETADERLLRQRREAEYQKAAQAISQILLMPVAEKLGNKRLLIVADGSLQYIPFAALPLPVAFKPSASATKTSESTDKPSENTAKPGSAKTRTGRASVKPAELPVITLLTPLIEEHEIVHLPSASVLGVLKRESANRRPAPKMIAVFADPVFSVSDERVQVALNKKKTIIGKTVPVDQDEEALKRARERENAEGAVANKPEQRDDLSRAIEEVGIDSNEIKVPRLPYSRQEALAILAAVPAEATRPALDFDASRATIKSEPLNQYRIIHFATHGLLNSYHPDLSGLIFSLVDERGESQDGFLRANEVTNLALNAELVVLSACQTGMGKEIRGEGLIGLTRSFMYAGAARVLVSLWNVNDKATSELMTLFYQKLLKEHLPAAKALRAAQLELRKQPQWQQPYYWAAFQLQGEW